MLSRVAKPINILTVLALIFFASALLSNAMMKELARDEQLFCTGGVLTAQGKMIYRDFCYMTEMPYHPLLYALIYKTLGTTHYLLAGRLVSVVCDFLIILLILLFFRRAFAAYTTAGTLCGLAAATLYLFNPFVDYANGFAWNHDFVIFCVMLSFWLFVTTDFNRKAKYPRLLLIGIILTVAVFTRLTTGLILALFFLILLFQTGRSATQKIKNIATFTIGCIIASIWPLYLLLSAPKAVYYNAYVAPRLYVNWLYEIGRVLHRPTVFRYVILTPANLALILLALCLWIMTSRLRKKSELPIMQGSALAILLPLAFFIIAFLPPTMWTQYMAMPVPFLAAGLAYPMAFLRNLAAKEEFKKYFTISIASLGIAVIVSVVAYPLVPTRIAFIAHYNKWIPVYTHRISKQIAERVIPGKKVLTLAPLYALEGGCEIYTELSAASFVYSVADSLTEEQRNITHTIGPKQIPALIDDCPPDAMILGVELDIYEKMLLNEAEARRWKKLTTGRNGIELYVRPKAHRSPQGRQ